MAVMACARAPPATRTTVSAARAPARSALSHTAPTGRLSRPQLCSGSAKTQVCAVAAPVRRSALQRPSRRPLTARADVNWDAFRSGLELNPYNSTAIKRNPDPTVRQFDFVVIGSGIAGLSYALKVAQYGSVAVVTKEYANDGCTQYAQGGVCAVLDAQDCVDNHVKDTMVAGGFLNDSKAVEVVCREGPARVLELAQLGADFTRSRDGTLHLTREGGHSHRRIVHAADLTGREIERALLESARLNPAISFFEHHLAVDLVLDEAGGGVRHCFGVDVLDQVSHKMTRFIGLATMLASGGAGQVYPNTTNPAVATGDGIAMAFRGGASISNMEFVQFHPTALAGEGEGGRVFLISEAVRGEGGQLFNMAGERFMTRYDDRMELAPRDVVARAIHEQMTTRGDPHVLLDISHKGRDAVLSHFPNIASKCAANGIDITSDPIPVLPAQHYTCGGVATGLLGETSIQGLFATGEVACSGLHGANRLASNSLLEGLVFADRAVGPSVAHAEYALKQCGRQLHYAAASADFSGAKGARPLAGPTAKWASERRASLRALMWQHAGIVRTSAGLRAALDEIAATYVEVKAVGSAYGINTQLVELQNLVTCAELVVSCALQRRESRGLHYVTDYPVPVASECRPSMISTSLRTRYNLEPLQSTIGRRPNGFISSVGLGAELGSGSASSNVSVGGGFGGGKGVRGGVRQQGVPGKGRSAARDLSVRSEKAPE